MLPAAQGFITMTRQRERKRHKFEKGQRETERERLGTAGKYSATHCLRPPKILKKYTITSRNVAKMYHNPQNHEKMYYQLTNLEKLDHHTKK